MRSYIHNGEISWNYSTRVWCYQPRVPADSTEDYQFSIDGSIQSRGLVADKTRGVAGEEGAGEGKWHLARAIDATDRIAR